MRATPHPRLGRAVAFSLAVGGMLTIGLATARLAAQDAAKQEPAKPKFTAKEVMQKAHQGNNSLFRKVTGGTGTAEDKKQLVEYYTALASNKQPKGDDDSWKTKTTALLKAAEAVDKGDKDGIDLLKKAGDCKSCHDIHRPPPARRG